MLFAMYLVSIFLEYARPGYVFPIVETIKLNSIFPLATFVFAVFASSKVSFQEIFSHYNTKWLLFFLFLIIVSVLTADIKSLATELFKGEIGYLFFFVMTVRLIDSIGKLKGLILSLIVAHIFLLINNPELVLEPETRSYIEGGTFLGDGNDFSLSVVILVPLALFLYLDTNNVTKKYFYLALLIILILAAIGTQSRGATIALAGGFLYLWWRGKSKVWGVVVMLILVAGVFVYAPPAYFSRMNTISNYENEGSAQGRIMAWKSGVRMAVANPLLGQGLGHFPLKLGTEFRPVEYGDQNLPWLTAHSCYFLVLGELGFPGLIYFIGILYMNIRRHDLLYKSTVKKETDEQKSFNTLFVCSAAAMLNFAVAGAFLSATYYPHIFILAGMFFSIQYLYKKHLNSLLEKSQEKEMLT